MRCKAVWALTYPCFRFASRSSATQKISDRADTWIFYLDQRPVKVVAFPFKCFRHTGKSVIHSYHNWAYYYVSIPLYHVILLLGTAATPYRCSREAKEIWSHWIHSRCSHENCDDSSRSRLQPQSYHRKPGPWSSSIEYAPRATRMHLEVVLLTFAA